jgi:hypothetical protein
LYGLKENVILGKLVPAGTGLDGQDDQALLEGEEEIDDDALAEEPIVAEALEASTEPQPEPAAAD